MFLKAADPNGFAVTDGERRYPVRDGVFLIAPDDRDRFRNFHEAGEVDAEVARELADLGNWPVDDDTVFMPSLSIDDALAEQHREDDEESDLDPETDDELENEPETDDPEVEHEQGDDEPLESDPDPDSEDEDEDDEQGGETPEPVTIDDLLKLSRADLHEAASAAGVEAPEKLKNKTAVAEAIVSAQ